MSFGSNDLGYRDLILGSYMKGLRDVGTCQEQIDKFRSGYTAFQSNLTKALFFIEQALNPNDSQIQGSECIISYAEFFFVYTTS